MESIQFDNFEPVDLVLSNVRLGSQYYLIINELEIFLKNIIPFIETKTSRIFFTKSKYSFIFRTRDFVFHYIFYLGIE